MATTVVAVVEKLSAFVDKHHRFGNEAGDVREFDDQMTGGDVVAGAERRRRLQAVAVEQSAVLAAQILDAPVVAGAHQRHVLARQTRVVGIAQFAGGGAAQHDAVAIQRDGDGLALQIAHDQFPG